MAENCGWVILSRKIQDNWIWENPDMLKAWLDLIFLMNFKDRKLIIDGQLKVIKRGQYFTSIRNLASRWEWSKDRVERFLKLLESDEMITRSRTPSGTLLTLIKYEDFQGQPDTDKDTNKDTDKDTDKDKKNKRKEFNKRKEYKEASPKKNSIDSFEQRTIDADELEKRMLNKAKEVVDVDNELDRYLKAMGWKK